MKILIKKIYFYNDGTYTEENFDFKDIDTNENSKKITEILKTPSISRRIAYNLSIYLKSKELYKSDEINFLNDAVNIIARDINVSNSTILDKLYRQLNLKSYEYKKNLIKALNGNTYEFKKLLLKNVGRNSKEEDERIINEII